MLLSIVIPTKDRYKYLLPLLRLLDGYGLENTEFVVEDNSYNNQEFLDFRDSYTLKTPIRYNYNPHQLPISQNIDNAINHSVGKYVCVIGDDDAVTPFIEDYVRWMDKEHIDSVRQKVEITYKWPTYMDDSGNYLGAVLTYGILGSKSYHIDTKKAVENIVRCGLMSMSGVPCVYQGIVKRIALNELNKIGGTYFPGPSPDMANAVSLAFVVKKHCVTDVPLVISGGSEYQGGRSEKIKSWVQPLEKIPFISDKAKAMWDKRIPYYWSGNTVWPESAIKGLEYVGQEEFLDRMNFDLLLAKCLYESFESRMQILSRTNNKCRVYCLYFLFFVREELAKIKRTFMRRFNLSAIGTKRVTGIMSIEEAIEYLKKAPLVLYDKEIL